MSVNKVNLDGSLLRVAGGTLYADAPIGAEFGYEGATIPNGYLACDGSTITQADYPELYVVIGGTLPNKADTIIKAKQVAVPFDVAEYIRNQNVLSEYETASGSFTAEYDGFITARVSGTGTGVEIKINNVVVMTTSNADYGVNGASVLFKKGDVIVTNDTAPKVCYYKLRDYSGRN